MPKKKQTRNSSKKAGGNHDVTGIILITIGVITLFGLFSTTASGMLGNFIRRILIAFIGFGAYIFPLLIIFVGSCYILKKGKISFSKRFYAINALIINTLLLVQMLTIRTYYIDNSISKGIKLIYESQNKIHGGILSFLVDVPFYELFGLPGSYVIFVAIYMITLILISQVSLYHILSNLKEKSRLKRRNDSDETVKDSKIPEDVHQAPVIKQEEVKNATNKIKIIDFMKSFEDPTQDKKNEIHKPDIAEPKKKEQLKEDLEEEIIQNSHLTTYSYGYPEVDLLNQNSLLKLNREDKKELIQNANKLEETLASFGVEAKVVQVTKGPSVTRFELQPNAGVKVSKIVNLSDDIALNLASSGVRIEAPIPGKSAIGIEVPNKELTPVYIREVIESNEFTSSSKNLAFCLGKDIAGNCVVSDLSKMPHMLIAGATGSGKSVCINTLIISLLYKYSPEEVKLLMIDPKVVELSIYNGIPHLLIPVVTDPKKAAGALHWAVNEMTKRYKLFADNSVRNIESYNELVSKGKIESKLPFIVLIIDELADLMMVCPNDIEDYIGRLAQMARAAGMHLVVATQRPSVDVITGVIKANIPSRISFAVSSQIDSRTILDMSGAEKLLGKGDMLFYPVGESKPLRIQGAFISEEEVEKVVSFVKNAGEQPEYKSELLEQLDSSTPEEGSEIDDLLPEAVRIVIESGQASASLLQRRLRIGYNRAARIIEQMEERGLISSRDGSKPRQILVKEEELEEMF